MMHTKKFLFLILCWIVFSQYPNLQAQKLVVYAEKIFSNDNDANKAWGFGGELILDQLLPRLEISLGGGYGFYNDNTRSGYGKSIAFKQIRGGVGVYYKKKLKNNFNPNFDINLLLGPEANYFNLINKHSEKTVASYYYVTQTGYMLGLGAGINLHFIFKNVVGLGFQVSPAYLIPLKAKCDRPNEKILYKKGIFNCDLRLQLIFKLGPGYEKPEKSKTL